jgi:hypothetical protein
MIAYINYLIAAIGIAALWCSGGQTRSRRAGFVLQIVNQAIWIVYGTATAQYGFVAGAVVFGTVAVLNLWRLRRNV